MKSIVERRGLVPFSAPSAERAYMVPFMKCTGLPATLRHWQPTVDAMLDGIDTDAPVFFMLDQRYVEAGATLRRPGVHVDGHWIPSLEAHGGGGHGSGGGGGRHSNPGGHGSPGYTPEPTPKQKPAWAPVKRKPKKPKHLNGRHVLDGVGYDEAIILASNITGAVAYVGDYAPVYGDGNSVDPELVRHLDRVVLDAGYAWAGNVGFVHESTPLPASGFRQVVRLNVPGWCPT